MNSFLDKLLRRIRFKKVVKLIPKDSIVCDIGCGVDALFLKSIRHLIRRGVGIDQGVIEKNFSNLIFIKHYLVDEIPLESGEVDTITMIALLEHLNSPQKILNECFRILKPKGKLILITNTPMAKWVLEFLAFKLKLIDEKEIRDHKNYFKSTDLMLMFSNSGFDTKKIKFRYFNMGFNILAIAQKP